MRAVVDTNSVISALVFPGRSARLSEAWRNGRLRLIASPAVVAEYIRVLHYPKFKLSEELIAALLHEALLPYLEPAVEFKGALIRPCRDPDDDIFLRAALGAKADWLVSGDTDLIALNGSYPFKILSPADALAHASLSRSDQT